MRTIAISTLFFLTVVLWTRCGTGEEPLFIMQLESEFVIPPGLNSFDTHYFYVRNVPTRVRNYVDPNVDPSTIGRVLPNRAELNATFVNIDWAIVREISIHAISASDPSVSKEIFYHDRIDFDNVNELRLFSSLSEVRDILFQDNMTLEVRINFRRPTPVEIESRLTMNFVVNGPE